MRFWQEHGFQYPAVFSIFAPKLITSAQKTDSVISRLTEKCHRIVIVLLCDAGLLFLHSKSHIAWSPYSLGCEFLASNIEL